MSDSSATIVPSLVLRRTYNATPEQLFAAWTTPGTAAVFMGPGNVKATDIKMDVRVGGAYQIVMVMEDGTRMPVRGVYRVVDRPRRLVMTWQWEEDNPADERETLLSLDFNARGEQTELVLTHERFASAESRDNHEHGWNAILDALPNVL